MLNARSYIAGVFATSLAACSENTPPLDASTGSDGSSVSSDAPDHDPRFDRLAAAIERDLADSAASAATVSVWLEDEIVWVGGFGTTEPGGRTPDENTLFMIGSDTKKIAAITLLQEVAAGHTTLETQLGEVLPDLRLTNASTFLTASMDDLLSHEGGVADSVGPASTDTTDADARAFAYGAFARSARAMAPPGLFYNYSNPNYAMAGLATETLAGQSWADVATSRVFAPLGMTRTFARKSDVDENHAAGFDGMDAVPLEGITEHAFMRPAGFVWSTPNDQMRLARFLVDGDEAVLPSALLAAMHAPHSELNPGLSAHYGYGLFVDEGVFDEDGYHAVPVWSHGGNTETHTSTFFILPEQRFAISILSNGPQNDFSRSVEEAISSLVTFSTVDEAPALPEVDTAALDALTGTYLDESNVGEIVVTREGSAMMLSLPRLDMAGIPYQRVATPITTRTWRASIQNTSIVLRLYEGPDGARYIVHRAFVARSVEASARRSLTYVPASLDLRALSASEPLPFTSR